MRRTLLLAALLSGLLATPAQASHFPTEIAVGPTLGLTGPGLAWRQFLLPWLGYQVGGNTLGFYYSYGGALLVSPYHNEAGQRVYLTGGVASLVPTIKGIGTPEVVPALGIGASKQLNPHVMYFADVSFIYGDSWLWGYIVFPVPQLGVMVTF